MKKNNNIDIAFIGAGNIAEQHMEYLVHFDDVNIVGIHDINKKNLMARNYQFGIDVYQSIDKVLDNSNPDAVYICLPPYSHGEAEFACIKRKIPFIVEKPLSNDLDLARKIADDVNASGLITCSAYMNRYRKGVNEAKKILDKYPVTLVYGGWLFDTPNNHPWITKKKLSGGQILEQTTHLFDLVRYLCGEIKSIHCYGCKGIIPQTDKYDIEDATSVSMQLQSGAVASITSSWSIGFDRHVYLNLSGPDIQVEFKNREFDTKIKSRENSTTIEIPGEHDIFVIQSRAFLDAVKQDDPSKILSDYSDGVQSLQISFAALNSMENQKEVSINK